MSKRRCSDQPSPYGLYEVMALQWKQTWSMKLLEGTMQTGEMLKDWRNLRFWGS